MRRMPRKYLVLFSVIIILVVGVAVLASRNDDSTDSAGSNSNKGSTFTSESDGLRKNDASSLLQASQEFAASNNGKQAVGWSNNQLTGGNNVELELEYYETVTVKSGAQSALSKDGIVLVTRASCGEDGKAVSGSDRSDAVQYMLSSGPTCQNM